jgi:hypothetical protein
MWSSDAGSTGRGVALKRHGCNNYWKRAGRAVESLLTLMVMPVHLEDVKSTGTTAADMLQAGGSCFLLFKKLMVVWARKQRRCDLKFIAEQAARRSGGTAGMIKEKRSRILLTFKSRLSTSPARQMAQLVFAHVHGSAAHGQYAHPLSTLLSLSNATE